MQTTHGEDKKFSKTLCIVSGKLQDEAKGNVSRVTAGSPSSSIPLPSRWSKRPTAQAQHSFVRIDRAYDQRTTPCEPDLKHSLSKAEPQGWCCRCLGLGKNRGWCAPLHVPSRARSPGARPNPRIDSPALYRPKLPALSGCEYRGTSLSHGDHLLD